MESNRIGGGSISCQITSVRLVVGAWCLMTLVLVNVYNGILISYVMAIHRAPPIASTELDIAFNPNIRLVVDKGQSGDLWFSVIIHAAAGPDIMIS